MAEEWKATERRHAPLLLALAAAALLLAAAGAGTAVRWLHLVFGVLWFGTGYFLLLVALPATRTYDPSALAQHVTRVVPRALFWMRYASLVTVAAGFGLYYVEYVRGGKAILPEAHDAILAGMGLGLALLGIVWGVVGPTQERMVAAVRRSPPLPPEMGRWQARALAASRAGFVLSLFVLLFMGAAGHGGLPPAGVAALLAAAVLSAWAVAGTALRKR